MRQFVIIEDALRCGHLKSNAPVNPIITISTADVYQYVLNSTLVILAASNQPPSVDLSNPMENKCGNDCFSVTKALLPAIEL